MVPYHLCDATTPRGWTAAFGCYKNHIGECLFYGDRNSFGFFVVDSFSFGGNGNLVFAFWSAFFDGNFTFG